jgi:hypothetical protein
LKTRANIPETQRNQQKSEFLSDIAMIKINVSKKQSPYENISGRSSLWIEIDAKPHRGKLPPTVLQLCKA